MICRSKNNLRYNKNDIGRLVFFNNDVVGKIVNVTEEFVEMTIDDKILNIINENNKVSMYIEGSDITNV